MHVGFYYSESKPIVAEITDAQDNDGREAGVELNGSSPMLMRESTRLPTLFAMLTLTLGQCWWNMMTMTMLMMLESLTL